VAEDEKRGSVGGKEDGGGIGGRGGTGGNERGVRAEIMQV